MIKLPNDFTDRMKEYLGNEYGAFLDCYDMPAEHGIRLNTLKCSAEVLKNTFPVVLRNSPFSPLSFYIDEDIKVGKLPLHSAGAFYSQEPSASSAVTILDPKPGDKVLDMCAAPGGKSTQIAALLGGRGLLWSNEVVRSRANILLSNVERMGIKNAVVSSVYPDVIAKRLSGFFDKILVDAPCSGEGMFRKNQAAVAEWSVEHVKTCAVRQLAILDCAAECLVKNGILVYSTCTFSYEENEGVCKGFLAAHPDFEMVPIDVEFGRSAFEGIPALRIFPMDGGEGHFVAKFKRKSENFAYPSPYIFKKQASELALAQELYAKIFLDKLSSKMIVNSDLVLILPDELPELTGLGVLRAGLAFGEIQKNRIEPHHAAFMAAKKDDCVSCINFSQDSSELMKYLHGEEIECDNSGYTAVCAEGITVGFGKSSAGKLKNRYPKGLRYL